MVASGTTGGRVVVDDVNRPALTSDYWPINWSAIWVGTLSALAVAMLISLIGAATGAHQLATAHIGKWSDVGFAALVFGVAGAFFSFVVGGWVAGKINGFRRAERDMLHGAIVWLVALPLLVGLAALGAGTLFGGWYAGLGGIPVWVTQNTPADPAAARNAALFAAAALLIGLIGAVLGGWLASGEPMSIYLYRTRTMRAG